MPTLDITVTVTDAELAVLVLWFPTWNSKLTVPFATIQDAIASHTQSQVEAWVKDAQPVALKDAYDAADEATRQLVRDAVGPILGVDLA